MHGEEIRNRLRARVEQWQGRLQQLRAARNEAARDARGTYVERLQELQAQIAEDVRQWNASIDEYDADPAQTTQKEFEEQIGLREIEKQIDADLRAWKREGHGIG